MGVLFLFPMSKRIINLIFKYYDDPGDLED